MDGEHGSQTFAASVTATPKVKSPLYASSKSVCQVNSPVAAFKDGEPGAPPSSMSVYNNGDGPPSASAPTTVPVNSSPKAIRVSAGQVIVGASFVTQISKLVEAVAPQASSTWISTVCVQTSAPVVAQLIVPVVALTVKPAGPETTEYVKASQPLAKSRSSPTAFPT